MPSERPTFVLRGELRLTPTIWRALMALAAELERMDEGGPRAVHPRLSCLVQARGVMPDQRVPPLRGQVGGAEEK